MEKFSNRAQRDAEFELLSFDMQLPPVALARHGPTPTPKVAPLTPSSKNANAHAHAAHAHAAHNAGFVEVSPGNRLDKPIILMLPDVS